MEHLLLPAFNRKLVVVSKNNEIVELVFDNSPRFKYILRSSKENKSSKLLNDAAKQIREYETKKRKSFDIKLKPIGTKFQMSVWEEIKNIPYGKTVSYLEVAKKIKRPRAYRAVANAIGKNPIAVIIPCHRIIRQNGDLGGFSSGIKTKILLQDLELSI
jgi:methylated-DNA-[protein]-cysteine S-methyltransferase